MDEMKETLLQLQQTLFYARYGDIFAQICKKVTDEDMSMEVLGWQRLQNDRWRPLAEQIQEEIEPYDRYITRDPLEKYTGPTDFPIHELMHSAARAIEIDSLHMVKVVHFYAQENELLHSKLDQLIETAQFPTLAKVLWHDLRDIPKVTPRSSKDFCEVMKTIIRCLIDIWYDIPEGWEDQCGAWNCSKNLLERSKNLAAKKETHQSELITSILERAKWMKQRKNERRAEQRKNERRTEETNIVNNMLTGVLGLESGRNLPRSVAPADLEEERKKLEKQKADWKGVLDMADVLLAVSAKYKLEYGEIGSPLEIMEDDM
jgi:hypothetical protein